MKTKEQQLNESIADLQLKLKETKDFLQGYYNEASLGWSNFREAKRQLKANNNLHIGQIVYHEDIYDCGELMEVVGIRATELELYGDYSGGTHSVRQTSWMRITGVHLTQNKVGK